MRRAKNADMTATVLVFGALLVAMALALYGAWSLGATVLHPLLFGR